MRHERSVVQERPVHTAFREDFGHLFSNKAPVKMTLYMYSSCIVKRKAWRSCCTLTSANCGENFFSSGTFTGKGADQFVSIECHQHKLKVSIYICSVHIWACWLKTFLPYMYILV